MYPYAVCRERNYAFHASFSSEEAAEEWLAHNLNGLIYLEIVPDILYLKAVVALGVETIASEEGVARYYALTDSGVHCLSFRHIDGVLIASPGIPRSEYNPQKEKKRERTRAKPGHRRAGKKRSAGT